MEIKPISRQRKWQLEHIAQGLCQLCNEPLHTSVFCLKHCKGQRERGLKRYRERVGIPLDAPLDKRGRKRKENTLPLSK